MKKKMKKKFSKNLWTLNFICEVTFRARVTIVDEVIFAGGVIFGGGVVDSCFTFNIWREIKSPLIHEFHLLDSSITPFTHP